MKIFYFKDYKKFVKNWIESQPKRGHGQYRKMANFLSIGSVNVTQIFNGERHLSQEQALELAEYFGFNALEKEYFVLLIQKERAGSHKLKNFYEEKLLEIRNKSQDLKQILPQETQLTEETKAIFYSRWHYSGIRMLSSIDGYNSISAIAEYYKMPMAKVSKIIQFLLEKGLCIEKDGKIVIGPKSTHLESSSPLVNLHHENWRQVGMKNMEDLTDSELFFTMPCSLSEEALKKIRKEIMILIEKATHIVDEAPSEKLGCLNIDLFKF